jgi:hypothetical protein
MMKLITERSLIRGVAKRWREQYPAGRDEKRDEIFIRLSALNKEAATAAEVSQIVGNASWTEVPTCDECGERSHVLVEIGQEPDYESSTATICVTCLHQAVLLAKGAE